MDTHVAARVLDLYSRYCDNPTEPTAASLWELLSVLDAADLDPIASELCVIKTKYYPSPGELQWRYPFAPLGWWWVPRIEAANKFPMGRRPVVLINNTLSGKPETTVIESTDQQFNYIINVGWFYDDSIIEIIASLGDCALRLYPEVMLYLATNDRFVALVNQKQLPLITTNHEPFYRRDVFTTHINDCMIDWETCLNFYQCYHGTYHCLPLFVRQGSHLDPIINLCADCRSPSDMFVINGISQCTCGRKCYKFTFVPHYLDTIKTTTGEIIYFPKLAEQLNYTYQNLQFIQTGPKSIDVLYVAESEGATNDNWLDYFENHGFECRPLNNRCLNLRDKRYVFFANKNKIEYRTIGSHGL